MAWWDSSIVAFTNRCPDFTFKTNRRLCADHAANRSASWPLLRERSARPLKIKWFTDRLIGNTRAERLAISLYRGTQP